MGYVHNRIIGCCILLTVRVRLGFPITGKRTFVVKKYVWRVIFYYLLVDSANCFLAYAGEIFPDKEHFGRIFEIMPRYRRWVFHKISTLMPGSCVVGRSVSAIMN